MIIWCNGYAQLMDLVEGFSQAKGIKAVVVKSQVRALLTVFRGSLRNNGNAKAVLDDLVQLGIVVFWLFMVFLGGVCVERLFGIASFFSFKGLAQDKSKLLGKYYHGNFASMSRTAIGQTLMVNKLVDLEWKFGG